jgi:hypothetical protein
MSIRSLRPTTAPMQSPNSQKGVSRFMGVCRHAATLRLCIGITSEGEVTPIPSQVGLG